MVVSIHVFCLGAKSILPAVVVAPTINHTTHGCLIVHTTTATHTAQFEDFNIHYLLSCPIYMFLNLPKTVHPNRPNTTDSLKHCIDDSDPADLISFG